MAVLMAGVGTAADSKASVTQEARAVQDWTGGGLVADQEVAILAALEAVAAEEAAPSAVTVFVVAVA
jgi:hypothetical protein